MRMGFAVFLVALATVVVPAGTALAETTSAGCDAINSPFYDGSLTAGIISQKTFAEGEVLTMAADEPVWENASPVSVTLTVNGSLVDSTEFAGTVTYEMPATGVYNVAWAVNSGPVTWDVSCTLPPDEDVDTDADGVLDDVDQCPGTVLPDQPTRGLKGRRFAAQTDGTFDSAKDGLDDRYTLADTAGCSGTQIIELERLGKSHVKFGISERALKAFIAEVSAG